MALILKNHSQDFIRGQDMDFTVYKSENVDIHHIFPKDYCENAGLQKQKWNSIINKTSIFEEPFMQKNTFFQEALADFAQEAANGGAIRHLADLGYTVRQIEAALDFPASHERVQRAVWEHLIQKEVILPEAPGSGGRQAARASGKEDGLRTGGGFQTEGGLRTGDRFQTEGGLYRTGAPRKKRTYVREYDQYGKASFRLAAEDEGAAEAVIRWKEQVLENLASDRRKRLDILREKVRENGEGCSYMSCDFGLEASRNPRHFEEMLDALYERQREYLSGLPWERRRVYHRLDSRMLEILLRLCEKELYQGECFFGKTEEKIKI